MTETRARFLAAVPQLQVTDLVRTAEHYRDVLGFGLGDAENTTCGARDLELINVAANDLREVEDVLAYQTSFSPEQEDRHMCVACERGTPTKGPRVCPICGHVFQGNGWDGIDAHWRARHEALMPYEEFWRSLCDGHRGHGR